MKKILVYEIASRDLTRVFLNKKYVGKIVKWMGSDGVGYQYFPKGKSFGGEVFKTLGECKNSLESE